MSFLYLCVELVSVCCHCLDVGVSGVVLEVITTAGLRWVETLTVWREIHLETAGLLVALEHVNAHSFYSLSGIVYSYMYYA